MRCANCGAELKPGRIACSFCGRETQIMPDTSLIEEELLQELLQEEEASRAPSNKGASKKEPAKKGQPPKKQQQKQPQKQPQKEQKKGTQKEAPKKSGKGRKSHKALVISLVCVCGLIATVVALMMFLNHRNRSSYAYQIQRAEKYVSELNYVKALTYYQEALSLKEDDVPARVAMAELYISMGDSKTAFALLEEAISLDNTNASAYQLLIQLYEKDHDYQAILELMEGVTDEAVLEVFSDYAISPPTFSLEPGQYAQPVSVELSAAAGYQIYYTLDGSDPREKGELYQTPISLGEQGTLKIKAVSCDEYGYYSAVAEGTYVVEFQKPQMPKATPDSGTFYEETTVTLTGIDNCRIYYTWDGSEPTTDSAEYIKPITVPEGNHILSVILVDEYGMVSDVLKCNYRYMP